MEQEPLVPCTCKVSIGRTRYTLQSHTTRQVDKDCPHHGEKAEK